MSQVVVMEGGCTLGPAPTHQESIIGVIIRALYNYIMKIIQLLMSGGSTQATLQILNLSLCSFLVYQR